MGAGSLLGGVCDFGYVHVLVLVLGTVGQARSLRISRWQVWWEGGIY